MWNTVGCILLGFGCLAIVLLALRQSAREADHSKCVEECIIRGEDYCDCGGWPIIPDELRSKKK